MDLSAKSWHLVTGIIGVSVGWLGHSFLGKQNTSTQADFKTSTPNSERVLAAGNPTPPVTKELKPRKDVGDEPITNPEHNAGNDNAATASSGNSNSGSPAGFNKAAAAKLSDADFGKRLTKLLREATSKEETAERDALISMLTPGRLAEFYTDYMRRSGIVREASIDKKLINVLTEMGKKDGWAAMDVMLAKFPGGFDRWDSLIHGWAIKDSQGAVNWFNDLPEDLPRRELALQGLMWGLAEKNGSMAGEVWKTLDERDRNSSAYGFVSSFGWAHGLKELDAWLTAADPAISKVAISKSTDYVMSRPPQESVPWLANHSDVVGLPPNLSSGFKQWVGTDARQAFDWLASITPTIPKGEAIQQQLIKTVTADKLDGFLRSNPDHPAAQLLK